MKKLILTPELFKVLIIVCIVGILQSCQPKYYSEADYFKVPKIDAHVHFSTTDARILGRAAEGNLKFITINVNSATDVSLQHDTAVVLVRKFPRQIHYLATFAFDTAAWNAGTWQQQTLAELEKYTAGGAVGVKLWKNIGMVERDRNGKFIMVSDARFDPVIALVEQKGLPLTCHLGEPKNCWLPLDSMTVNNDRNYFSRHPEYHMFLHPEFPSYQDQLDARDSLLVKHPNLKVIGCHLASEEWSVDQLARTLDRFPNLAVDLAARICHLQHQSIANREKVRDFLINYQDRIIYGTDMAYSAGKLDSAFFASFHKGRLNDWNFFTSAIEMQSRDVNGIFTGLQLPREVVDKIFYLNAVKWYNLKE